MRNWLAGLSFWPLLTYGWSLYLMFIILVMIAGFDPVVAALGGLGDRLGLVAP